MKKNKIIPVAGLCLFLLQTQNPAQAQTSVQVPVNQLINNQPAPGVPGNAGAATANSGVNHPDFNGRVSGTPRLVRDYPVPQVFFSDIPGSFYIPTNGDYNRIMNALNAALSRKISIKMVVDKNTKMITDLEAPKSQSGSSLYEDVPDDSSAGNKAGNGGGAAGGVGHLQDGPSPSNAPPAGAPAAPTKAPSGWAD